MFFLKKNPEFIFASCVPGVVQHFPVIDARTYRPTWVKEAAAVYKKRLEESSLTQQVSGLIKCPGIRDIMTTGFIVTSCYDIQIKTYGDGEKFTWEIPRHLISALMESREFKLIGEPVSWLSLKDEDTRVLRRPQSLNSLIKIQSTWSVRIPKGWSLLVTNVQYADEPRFSCVSGILRSGNGLQEIIPQLYWNVLEGEELIKAGTPLCQFIPIPDKEIPINMKCIESDDRDYRDRLALYYSRFFSFIRNKNGTIY